jgi:four helix bundle suffix protein
MTEGFIPPHGGYQRLLAYQKAEIVYDATVRFCDRWIARGDRTRDQMIQAARSGKQNIAEGSQASGTSKEMELKLTSVARASLEELLIDYRDFLRIRGLAEWPKDHPFTRRLRQLNRAPGANYNTFKKGLEHPDPAICANVIIGLIKVTTYLLDQQLRHLEAAFLREGGLRERMTRARLAARHRP